MRNEPLKILFTEGSSTSARQSLYALGRRGYQIDICDPQRLCLCRFSRYVRRFHRCPSFTAAPLEYLEFLVERLRSELYDVLFPVHDQVYLLARYPEIFRGLAGVALPPWESITKLQSKAGFARLLEELDLPRPRTTIVNAADDLAAACEYPCYVKLAYSTAGRGVWYVTAPADLPPLVAAIKASETDCGEIVVQAPVPGILRVTQAVFQHGTLVAGGSYQSRATGVGGSAYARESLDQPAVCADLARLGRHLAWHGALHVEYLCDPESGSYAYIEANPRIGESMNVTCAGVDLSEALVRVSLGDDIPPALSCRQGVRTHSVLTSILAQAEHGGGRGAILRELWHACRGRGMYEASEDELTRPREDPPSLLPAIFVIGQLLAMPSVARRIIRGTVDNYSLTAAAIRRINALPSELSFSDLGKHNSEL